MSERLILTSKMLRSLTSSGVDVIKEESGQIQPVQEADRSYMFNSYTRNADGYDVSGRNSVTYKNDEYAHTGLNYKDNNSGNRKIINASKIFCHIPVKNFDYSLVPGDYSKFINRENRYETYDTVAWGGGNDRGREFSIKAVEEGKRHLHISDRFKIKYLHLSESVSLTSSFKLVDDGKQYNNRSNRFFFEQMDYGRDTKLLFVENWSIYTASIQDYTIYSASNNPINVDGGQYISSSSPMQQVKNWLLQGDIGVRGKIIRNNEDGYSILRIDINSASMGKNDFGKNVSGNYVYPVNVTSSATDYFLATNVLPLSSLNLLSSGSDISASFMLTPTFSFTQNQFSEIPASEYIEFENNVPTIDTLYNVCYLHTEFNQSIPETQTYYPDGFSISMVALRTGIGADGYHNLFVPSASMVPLVKFSNNGYIMIAISTSSISSFAINKEDYYYAKINKFGTNEYITYDIGSFHSVDVVVRLLDLKFSLSVDGSYLGDFNIPTTQFKNTVIDYTPPYLFSYSSYFERYFCYVLPRDSFVAFSGIILSSDPLIPSLLSSSFFIKNVSCVVSRQKTLRNYGFVSSSYSVNTLIVNADDFTMIRDKLDVYNPYSNIRGIRSWTTGYTLSYTLSSGDKVILKDGGPESAIEFNYNSLEGVRDWLVDKNTYMLEPGIKTWSSVIYPKYRSFGW